jgi:hypothetical protein
MHAFAQAGVALGMSWHAAAAQMPAVLAAAATANDREGRTVEEAGRIEEAVTGRSATRTPGPVTQLREAPQP